MFVSECCFFLEFGVNGCGYLGVRASVQFEHMKILIDPQPNGDKHNSLKQEQEKESKNKDPFRIQSNVII